MKDIDNSLRPPEIPEDDIAEEPKDDEEEYEDKCIGPEWETGPLLLKNCRHWNVRRVLADLVFRLRRAPERQQLVSDEEVVCFPLEKLYLVIRIIQL